MITQGRRRQGPARWRIRAWASARGPSHSRDRDDGRRAPCRSEDRSWPTGADR